MFPVLFSIGHFEFRTVTIFILLAYLFSAFVFWRKGKEEHYSQAEIFDGFLVSSVVGALVARGVFVLFNTASIGFNPLNWLNMFAYPGFNMIAGLAAAAIYLYRYSLEQKWDGFEILDFWVTSISLGLGIYSLGAFFNGVGYGNPTDLPWGMVFPQLIEPHHPVQLYFAIFYFCMFYYLAKVEYSYRTFTWYRHGKKTAQTGFLSSMFLIMVPVFTIFVSVIRPATVEFFGYNIDVVISILVLLSGISLLFVRSGRSIPVLVKKKPKPVRAKIEQLNE